MPNQGFSSEPQSSVMLGECRGPYKSHYNTNRVLAALIRSFRPPAAIASRRDLTALPQIVKLAVLLCLFVASIK